MIWKQMVVGAIGVGLAVSFAVPASKDPQAEGVKRFNKVNSWHLKVKWSATVHDKKVLDEQARTDIETTTVDGNIGAVIDFKLTRAKTTGSKYYVWVLAKTDKPKGTLSYLAEHKVHSRQKDTGKEGWFSTKANVGGVGSGSARLEIDSGDGAFRLGFGAESAEGTIEQATSQGTSQKADSALSLRNGRGDWVGTVPAAGLEMKGEVRKVPCDASFVFAGRDMDVSWTLEPWVEDSSPQIDVPYDWLPEFDSQGYVTATWKGKAKQVRFTLYDVSSEPGTCMNSLADNKGPDFEITDQPDYQVVKVGNTWVATTNPKDKENCVLPIHCLDYGARAKVKCEVEVDGEWKTAKAPDKRMFATVPRDDDDNGIADCWEKNFKGMAVDSDTEKSTGNKLDGDGFTLYEEYRGLTAKGKFMRLDPKKKELFVINMLADRVRPGLKAFEKAADVKIVEIFRNEIDPGRVLNFRKATIGKGGDQHVLLLEIGNTVGGLGMMMGIKGPGKGANSPGECRQINFDINFDGWGSAASAKDVAHEVGHACGLRHHGDDAEVHIDTSLINADGDIVIKTSRVDYEVFDQSGKEDMSRPFTILNGWKVSRCTDSPAGGDVTCIMCYDQLYNVSFRLSGTMKQLALVPSIPVPTTFCKQTEGTGYNKSDHKPWPLFGDAVAGRGNCIAKVRIKDW